MNGVDKFITNKPKTKKNLLTVLALLLHHNVPLECPPQTLPPAGPSLLKALPLKET